jgi:hypothetical protein
VASIKLPKPIAGLVDSGQTLCLRIFRLLCLKDESPPFVTAFAEANGFSVPDDIVDQFSDLRYYTVIARPPSQCIVQMFWEDEASYNKVATNFQAKCRLTVSPFLKGQTQGPQQLRWRFDVAKMVAGGLSSIAVALAALLWPWFLGLWISPDFVVDKDEAVQDVLVNQRFTVQFTGTNQQASGTCDIAFGSIEMHKLVARDPKISCYSAFEPTAYIERSEVSSAIHVSKPPQDFKNFAPGNRPILVTAAISEPGIFKMMLPFAASSGQLRRQSESKPYRYIRVWNAMELSGGDVTRVGPDNCDVAFCLATGQEFSEGRTLQAELVQIPDVRFVSVLPPMKHLLFGTNPKKDAELTQVNFQSDQLRAFRMNPITLTLQGKAPCRIIGCAAGSMADPALRAVFGSDAADREAWKRLARHIKFYPPGIQNLP